MPRMVGISNEAHLPGLQAFTERMHRHGAMAGVQLNHCGKVATEDRVQGRPMLVPSVPHFDKSDMFDALTRAEIASFVGGASQPGVPGDDAAGHRLAGRAVRRGGRARVCAPVSTASRSMPATATCCRRFLSPHYNQRDDAYGGSAENRARLLVEVLRAVRATVGPDFPILCRLDANEFRVSDGITPQGRRDHRATGG
jgi:2,4-dienoyl-CoA reductase (NADPH2)